MEEKELEQYELTRNVIQNDKILGFNKRNIAEAIIFTLMLLLIIMIIPFTTLVKTIVSIVLGLTMFFGCLYGIKRRSVTEVFFNELRFRKNRRRTHLRGPEYVKKNIRTFFGESEDESIAEHYFKLFKEYLVNFVNEYGEEEDGEINKKGVK